MRDNIAVDIPALSRSISQLVLAGMGTVLYELDLSPMEFKVACRGFLIRQSGLAVNPIPGSC